MRGEKAAPLVSIIIPVLYEGENINSCIEAAAGSSGGLEPEFLVVDADPGASTLSALDPRHQEEGVRVRGLNARGERGAQMNAGARESEGDILLFLHADTLLPEGWPEPVLRVLAGGYARGGAFDLSFDSDRPVMRLIARLASLRSRLERAPYGDQVHFFLREYFLGLGGYPEIPLMEDVELFQRIKRRGEEVAILDEKVVTSARRYEEQGPLRRGLLNWTLRLRHAMGASPEALAASYGPRKNRH